MDMAHITVIGRLTGDPVLKNIGEKKQVTEFSVAVNHRYRNGDNWQEKEPAYFNVECWDRLAENAAFTMKKGMPVVVIGRAEQSVWFKEYPDGTKEKRVLHRINAQSISPHLGERVAEVQFDRKRSKKLEEEVEKNKREETERQAREQEMGPGGDTSGTDSLRGAIDRGGNDGERDGELVGAAAGMVRTGEAAIPPEGFHAN